MTGGPFLLGTVGLELSSLRLRRSRPALERRSAGVMADQILSGGSCNSHPAPTPPPLAGDRASWGAGSARRARLHDLPNHQRLIAFDIVEFHPFSDVQRVDALSCALCPDRDPRACLANLRVCACAVLRSALLLCAELTGDETRSPAAAGPWEAPGCHKRPRGGRGERGGRKKWRRRARRWLAAAPGPGQG